MFVFVRYYLDVIYCNVILLQELSFGHLVHKCLLMLEPGPCAVLGDEAHWAVCPAPEEAGEEERKEIVTVQSDTAQQGADSHWVLMKGCLFQAGEGRREQKLPGGRGFWSRIKNLLARSEF